MEFVDYLGTSRPRLSEKLAETFRHSTLTPLEGLYSSRPSDYVVCNSSTWFNLFLLIFHIFRVGIFFSFHA